MTAATLAEASPHTRPSSGSRVHAVFRLHFVNPGTTIVIPWAILAFIFIVNVAIWALIFAAATSASDRADAQEGTSWSGAATFLFAYMSVVAVQAVNTTFPFAQGYGVTRRDFYLGSSLVFVALSAMYAVGLTVLAEFETATDGWGFGAHMFTAVYYGDGPWFVRLGLFFALFLFFFFVGAMIATIYQRWRVNGMLIFFGTLTVLLLGAAALLTFGKSWPAFGGWFAANGATGTIAWSLVPTALSAVLGYAVLRRATPKN